MKKTITALVLIAILLVGLFTMTGCGSEEKNQTDEKVKTEENADNKTKETTESDDKKTNKSTESSTESKTDKTSKTTETTSENKTEKTSTTTTTTEKKTEKKVKEIDKTPIDINDVKSYYFVVDGKKYYSGDKISELKSSDLKLNKTSSEKEIPVYGYLIGSTILNSDNKTVFDITPYNNTNSKITGADAVIGGFGLYGSSYELVSNEIEIYGGITIGTSVEDVKAVFGEPTKTTENYDGSTTYNYNADASYREFNFTFDKEGKIKSMNWRNFTN